jgi:hypothetical protein
MGVAGACFTAGDAFVTDGAAGADAAGVFTLAEPDEWWCSSFVQMRKRARRASTARATIVA